MLGAIKTLGTVLTVASTAQFGKEMYDKYKGKKRQRQIDEVHEFIGRLDLDSLQEAINTNDTEALIDAVEDIMMAAEAVKVKSDLEELKDDATEVAKTVFSKVSTVVDKAMIKASQKFDELIEDEDEIDYPSYKEFKKGAKLTFIDGRSSYTVTVNHEDVSTNSKSHTVTFITPNGKALKVELD